MKIFLLVVVVAVATKAEPPVLGLTPPPPPPPGEHYHYEKFYPELDSSPVDPNFTVRPNENPDPGFTLPSVGKPENTYGVILRQQHPIGPHSRVKVISGNSGSSFVLTNGGRYMPVHGSSTGIVYGPPHQENSMAELPPPVIYGPPAKSTPPPHRRPSKLYGPPPTAPAIPSPSTPSTIYGPPPSYQPQGPSNFYENHHQQPTHETERPVHVYGPPLDEVVPPIELPSDVYGPPSQVYGPPPTAESPPQRPPPSQEYGPRSNIIPAPTGTTPPSPNDHPGYSYKVPAPGSPRLSYDRQPEPVPAPTSNLLRPNRFRLNPLNRQEVANLVSRLRRNKSSSSYLPEGPGSRYLP